MEFTDSTLALQSFLTVTLAILVLFTGKGLNFRFTFLRDLNIPEPVVGGLIFAAGFALIHTLFGITVEFDLTARDTMLVYFFTTIGLNANVKDLVRGGKPLMILLAATIFFMVMQTLAGVSIASLFGLDPVVGMLGGTISLIGGHGTAIAWAPTFVERYGIRNAMEIGVACATIGLILASLMGGPIANYLVRRHDLKPTVSGELDVGVAYEKRDVKIDYFAFLHAVLSIHVSIIIGYFLNEFLEEIGLHFPLFSTCLFTAIVLSSFAIPRLEKRFDWLDWHAKKTSMALIADISLGIFLAMSLMSIQLWEIMDLAGPIIAILAVQFLIALIVTVFVVFRLMGSSYDAAVISSGFGGFTLGSTATAMANMTAVTEHYGPSHLAFIVIPLIGAFFIDLFNVLLIQTSLSFF